MHSKRFIQYVGLNLFVEKLEELREAPLIVTHVTRHDIILGFLAHAQRLQNEGLSFTGALVITAYVYIYIYIYIFKFCQWQVWHLLQVFSSLSEKLAE